jgi:hypothetical protein
VLAATGGGGGAGGATQPQTDCPALHFAAATLLAWLVHWPLDESPAFWQTVLQTPAAAALFGICGAQ